MECRKRSVCLAQPGANAQCSKYLNPPKHGYYYNTAHLWARITKWGDHLATLWSPRRASVGLAVGSDRQFRARALHRPWASARGFRSDRAGGEPPAPSYSSPLRPIRHQIRGRLTKDKNNSQFNLTKAHLNLQITAMLPPKSYYPVKKIQIFANSHSLIFKGDEFWITEIWDCLVRVRSHLISCIAKITTFISPFIPSRPSQQNPSKKTTGNKSVPIQQHVV